MIGSLRQRPMSDRDCDLYRVTIPAEVIRLVPGAVAREFGAIPISRGHDLVVAMSEWDEETLDKLRFVLNRQISVVFATPEAIRFALDKYYPDAPRP